MNNLSISFEQARIGLLKMKPKTLKSIFSKLENLQMLSVSVQIIQELNPEFLQDYTPITEICPIENFSFFRQALDEIYELAPFEYELTYSGESRFLYPESMGFPLNRDSFNEICISPSVYPAYEVFLFFTCLRLGEIDCFNLASQEYGWEVEYPQLNNFKDFYLDWDLFCKNLEEAGFKIFITAIEVYEYSTGNLYFDVNLYDEIFPEDFDIPVFSLEGYKSLIKEYKAAQEIYKELMEAEDHFMNDRPENAKKLLKLWVSSLKETEKPKQRTLVEIFSEEDVDECLI